MLVDPIKIPNNTSLLVVKILCLLWEGDDAGQDLNVSRLSELSTGHDVSVSTHLYKLESAGLVIRRRIPSDRRQSLFSLTDRGRSLVDAWLPGVTSLSR